MRVIALILKIVFKEKRWTYFYLNSEWSKRKKWFKEEDGEKRIETLLKYYGANKEKAAHALKTGTPIYETMTWSQTKFNEPPKIQSSKTESTQTGIDDDDHWFNVMAKEDITIDGNPFKKGEQFVVLPKAFDEKTMVKIGTIPRCEPFTKFVEG